MSDSKNYDIDSILKEIEDVRESKSLPIIGPEKGKILDEVVKNYRPNLILEIGTLVGYSAIRMARLLPDNGKIICMEMDKDNAAQARKNIERAGLTKKISIIVGDAKQTIPTLNENFDLVFIDATKEEYLNYLKLVENKLKKGGVVVADNVLMFAEKMKDYLDYVRNTRKYSSSYHEPIFKDDHKDAVEVSVKL